MQYSMLVRHIEDGIIDYCDKNNIGLLAYSPLYKGLLSGAFNKQQPGNLPATDHRRYDPHFQEPALSANLQLVERLQ